MDRRSSVPTHSSSSRTGLVTRLGSALQSWTSGGGSKSWGSSTAAREGRPGPLGARYTQQASESYSPFEPSPHHQLQKKLPIQPAFTVAAAARRREVQGDAPSEELNAAGSDGRPAEVTTADTLPPTDSDGPESPGTQQSALKERRQEGRNAPPIDDNTDTAHSPRLRQGSSSDARNDCLNRGEGLGAEGSPITASTAAATASSHVVENGDKPLKKVGLWELKAERSRLENALAEAESDRDVQKARAWEAANRLEEAVARLEGVLQGGGVCVEGAADSVVRV